MDINYSTPISLFRFEGADQTVKFIETLQVVDGVECDVYRFEDDNTKDLGIIIISPGSKTPLQKVLNGDRTIEGHISGYGKLTITKSDGKKEIYTVDDMTTFVPVTVIIGELMQWESDGNSTLTVYEICFPPYEDGRYENLMSQTLL